MYSIMSKHRDCRSSENVASLVMFPGVTRTRRQQGDESVHGGRDLRKPTVVSLELKATPVGAGRAADCCGHRQRTPRNQSLSPLLIVDTTAAARPGVGTSSSWSDTKPTSSKSTSRDEVVMSPVTTVSFDSLPRDGNRTQRAAKPAAAVTNSKRTVAHLPPLTRADRACNFGERLPRRMSEGAVGPFEVCAVRLHPDRSTSNRGQFHRQQSTAGVAAGVSEKTAKCVSATSSSSSYSADTTSDSVKRDLHLPLSDSDNGDDEEEDVDDDNQETTKRSVEEMSMDGSVGTGEPGIMEASCPVLSVRIEFCKSPRKDECYVNSAAAATPRQSDSGAGGSGEGEVPRRLEGKTPTEMKNATSTRKPASPSKAISVAGRGKVVVIEDGVYDKFARRRPPKYVTDRT